MIQVKHKFQHQLDADFFKSLHKRVNSYFQDNGKSPFGESRLVIKTLVMLAVFFAPFIIILTNNITNIWLFYGCWIIMGFGVAGIGVNVMHDANHGVFTKHKRFNNFVQLVMNLLGGDASIWRLQHNVLHHSFTNIHEADEDIIGPPMLRFSPHDKKRKIHAYQHIYAWFLYGLMTIIKLTYTDIKRAFRYRKMNLIKSDKELNNRLIKIAVGKVFYFSYMLALPLILTDYSFWIIISGFLLMHLVTGVLLSIIFQVAHVMPSSQYPLPDENGKMDNNWAVHQMITTTNFSPKSRIFSWFIGGLNYQVEHHLFANISHIHYRDISKIVSATAQEFGIPYHCEKNFAYAVRNHGKMLHQLGR